MPDAAPEISIVVPMHNEEKNVRPLYDELTAMLGGLGRPYEILFVNDGSTDKTLDEMLELVRLDRRFAAVELDGNFGEAGGLSAGFATARGQIVVTMDGDLQNNPADVPAMLEKLAAGARVVSGWRANRKEQFWSRRLPSVIANRLIAAISGVHVHDTGCSLKAYRAEVVRGQNIPRGFQRFVPAVFGVRGRDVTELVTEDRARKHGRTHYGLSRTFEVLRDLTAIWFINRNPKCYAKVVPVVCLVGLGLVAAAFVAPLPTAVRCIGGCVGVVVAIKSAVAFYGIHRYNRAQIDKVYRIRAVHGQS
jgi:glycosyltransferase involved in cell wall biosynthesis